MASFIEECRRRRVLPVVAIYIVGAWIALQVLDNAFASWDIAAQKLRYVWIAAFLGFPVACLLGWRYDFRAGGIVRTDSTAGTAPLRRTDFGLLGISTLFAGGVLIWTWQQIVDDVGFELQQDSPRSIAVLPFDDMSPGADHGYFADGIAEEILNLLAHYNGLSVTSRSSAFALRDSDLSIPEMGARLGTAHILEGSVRQTGDRVRITAQLIDAATDTHLWSDTYDRVNTDLLEIQDDIAAEVARELQARLLAPARNEIDLDPVAYDLYLRGLSLFAIRDDTELMQAELLFEQVTEMAPDFAAAHAGIAMARHWQFDDSGAEEAAHRALELDPRNSDALAVLGRMLLDRMEYEAGIELLEQAIAANPSNVIAHRWIAIDSTRTNPMRFYSGIRNVYRLDPLDPTIHYHLALSSALLGRYDEAAELLAEFVERDSRSAYFLTSVFHRMRGDVAKQLKTNYLVEAIDAENTWSAVRIALVLKDLGELDLASDWLIEFDRRGGDRSYTAMMRAAVAALQGDTATARTLITESINSGELQGQPAAVSLVARAQLPLEARTMMQEFLRLDSESPVDPTRNWDGYIVYASTFAPGSMPEELRQQLATSKAKIKDLLADGVIHGQTFPLQFDLARVCSLLGETAEMVSALRRAVEAGTAYCTECLLLSPVWDAHRDNPEFLELLDQQQLQIAAIREQLRAEGQLLTPQQLKSMGTYDFSPFEL